LSTTIITIEEVTSVKPHPDADRLDVIEVLGYQVVTGKGNVKVGDRVYYFPPDIMIPPEFSVPLGVQQYLKHARMSTDTMKIQCRVSAARLRGLPSYGFIAPCASADFPLRLVDAPVGTDVTAWFKGEKYEPPVRLGGGDSEPDMPNFHRYSNIENIQRRNQFEDGEEVVFTEKIHGTNCRMGYVLDGDEMTFQAGSNKLRRKAGEGLYWAFFTDEVKGLLQCLYYHYVDAEVILFGEIYGPGVQDMQYGETEKRFRAFDCSVNGKYLDKPILWKVCEEYGVETVPLLYEGPFSKEAVAEHTDGKSTFPVTGKFKGREGIVITPLTERLDYRGNRVIAKSVSVDYLNRKGAEDNE
jgi:RNA ligase (TIGR02306 family)